MKQTIYLTLGLIFIIIIVFITGCTKPGTSTNERINDIVSDTNLNENINADQVEIDPSLIAHWEFDENNGSITTDLANEYSGTISGDTSWVEGQSGSALYFDGEGDYVEISPDIIDEIGELNQGTVSFWFKFDSLLDTQPIMPIFYLGTNDDSDQNSMFIIELGHANTRRGGLDPENKKLYVTWVTDTGDPILCYDSRDNIEEDTWYHFALVVGSEGNTGYLSGKEMENRYYNFGASSDQYLLDIIPTKEQFTLGYGRTHYAISPDFVFFKGHLDDLRIYNRPLTSSEIQKLLLNNL